MTEIEPIIENVKLGDVVVIESGTPDSPGWVATAHKVSDRGGFCPITIEHLARNLSDGKRLTRITRPSLPIPTKVGERFWARYEGVDHVEEFIVTLRHGETLFVSLHDGLTWTPKDHDESFTVVPDPEPETVPVPADLIQEAEEWVDGPDSGMGRGDMILYRITQAVREREGES